MTKERVPKRNVSRMLADIRNPKKSFRESPKLDAINLTHIPKAPQFRFFFFKKVLKRIAIILGIIVLLGAVFLVTSLGELEKSISESTRGIVGNFFDSAGALREFRTGQAIESLERNKEELSGFQGFLDKTHGQKLLEIFGSITPLFRGGLSLFGEVNSLNDKFLELANELNQVERSGLRHFQSDGKALIVSLEKVRVLVEELNFQIQSTRNKISSLKESAPMFGEYEALVSEDYLKYSAELIRTEKFLGAFIALLREPGEKHIVVLFQNAAEARPGGGFVGSYADLTIEGGQLKNIDVKDIYDPDGQLSINVVPPTEINTMTRRWGARDANWFFDFPTSAKTILYFLERSKIYSEKDITFEGVIGINTYVFESILEVTGPIPVEEYKHVIDKDNFHELIQREVEEGEDKELGEPKRILKIMAPMMLDKLKTLSDEDMKKLVEKIFTHIEEKNVMIYAKNQDIASFLHANGVDGSIYELPNSFFGSYLAVINSNVAGGKTDIFMEQDIEARIDLDTNSGIFTDLTIKRTHNGESEEDKWWRVPNKNFIQIYTNQGSSLVSIKGNDIKTLKSKFDYDANGYIRLPQLAAIEKTKVFLSSYSTWVMQAFEKTSFGTWFNVNAGKSKTLEMRYQLPASDSQMVSSGKVYTFIFERQSGVKSKIKATISAPLGYKFKESQSPLFTFEDEGGLGRIVIPLTLEK